MNRQDLPESDYTAWHHILPGAEGEYSQHLYSGTFSVHDGARVEDVSLDRIARVDLWYADNAGDGYADTDFYGLVELTDGTWATFLASCDTTGWDCQAGVEWKWARTRDEAIAQGLHRHAREVLDVLLPGEVTS